MVVFAPISDLGGRLSPSGAIARPRPPRV